MQLAIGHHIGLSEYAHSGIIKVSVNGTSCIRRFVSGDAKEAVIKKRLHLASIIAKAGKAKNPITSCLLSNKSQKGLLIGAIITSLLSACTITPTPLTDTDRYTQAKKDVAQLFSANDKSPSVLTYEAALARGIRFNYDYRIKLVNNALQAGQLRIAEFTMYPDLKTTASLYTRSNDYSTFGITQQGQPTGILTSTPRTLRSLREGFTWNLLDLGMGYVRAKQQADRVLIAEEESRKQLQLLAQDIRIAYWKAYSAQELLREANALQNILNKTEKRMQSAIADELVPKEDILKFRGAMLGSDRQLVELSQKLDKALIDLKHLLKLPFDNPLVLKRPPASISRVQNIENINFKKLDTISLIMRPELRGQNYMERIAKFGVKAAILQVFPGITLNQGWNYNSNKFLANNIWIDKSVDVSWSLLNLVSLPTTINTAETQIKYEQMKSMALTLGVMTQTRYACSQYISLAKEYSLAKKQADNAEALYTLTKDRNMASLASKQQVVYAKLQSMIAKMDRDLILADLSTALGELYLSAGFDVLPADAYNLPMDQTIERIRKNSEMQGQRNFSQYVDATYDELMAKMAAKEKPVKPAAVTTHEKARVVATNSKTPVLAELHVPTQTTTALVAPFTAPATDKLNIHNNSLYTLQIFGSYNYKEVKRMRSDIAKTNKDVYCGSAKFNGRDWYVLTYGTFVNANMAKNSVASLPQKYQNKDAFPRPTQDINWGDCGPKSSKLMSAFKQSLKKSLAMQFLKDSKHYARNAYQKLISTWTV
jgi:multidrug efflux system outer membrane protein